MKGDRSAGMGKRSAAGLLCAGSAAAGLCVLEAAAGGFPGRWGGALFALACGAGTFLSVAEAFRGAFGFRRFPLQVGSLGLAFVFLGGLLSWATVERARLVLENGRESGVAYPALGFGVRLEGVDVRYALPEFFLVVPRTDGGKEEEAGRRVDVRGGRIDLGDAGGVYRVERIFHRARVTRYAFTGIPRLEVKWKGKRVVLDLRKREEVVLDDLRIRPAGTCNDVSRFLAAAGTGFPLLGDAHFPLRPGALVHVAFRGRRGTCLVDPEGRVWPMGFPPAEAGTEFPALRYLFPGVRILGMEEGEGAARCGVALVSERGRKFFLCAFSPYGRRVRLERGVVLEMGPPRADELEAVLAFTDRSGKVVRRRVASNRPAVYGGWLFHIISSHGHGGAEVEITARRDAGRRILMGGVLLVLAGATAWCWGWRG